MHSLDQRTGDIREDGLARQAGAWERIGHNGCLPQERQGWASEP